MEWFTEKNLLKEVNRLSNSNLPYYRGRFTDFKQNYLINKKIKCPNIKTIGENKTELLPYNKCKRISKYLCNIDNQEFQQYINSDDTLVIQDNSTKVLLVNYKGIKLLYKVSNEDDEVPNKKSMKYEFYSELYVGMIINKLRKDIPNFMYTFTFYIDEGPNISFPIPHCIYEYIDNGIIIFDFCNTCTERDFIEQFLIICLSLRYACIKFGFTHYDLHGKNVIIKTLSKQKNFKYESVNDTINFKTKYVPIIIDFGLSCIKSIEQTGFNLRSIFIDNEPNLLCDFHKLFYCLVGQIGRYPNIVKYIHEFLHPNVNIEDIIGGRNYRDLLFLGLPRHPKIDHLILADQFIDHLLNYNIK